MVHAARAALSEAVAPSLSLVSCDPISIPVAPRATVLVVQSNALTLRSVGRWVEQAIGRVLLAESPGAAEAMLVRETGRPVFVVCGQDFGADEATGAELLVRWRARFPAVCFTVLATGAEGAPMAGGAIDAVFEKPGHPEQLSEMLVAAQDGLRTATSPNHCNLSQEST